MHELQPAAAEDHKPQSSLQTPEGFVGQLI